MNHNVAIANMNAMAGPIGGAAPMPMMNNGNITMVPQPSGPVGAPQTGATPRNADRSQLNKYIYDYFLRNGMYECARALLNSDKSVTNAKVEGGKNGNLHGSGVDDAMDTDTKDDIDQKLPEDLPPPDVPNTSASDTSFLYDWFCLFWEMWKAQGKSGSTSVHQYVNHTQAQSRMKQNHQQEMLRQMRGDMGVQQHLQAMRNMQQQNGAALAMNMKQGGNLARTAMANNQNNPQVMQMMQAKQGPRDPSELDNMRQRAASPGSENAASPSKRPRLDGPPFNPGQPGMIPNGRPVQGIPGQPGAMHNNANQILMAAGVQTAGLTQAQLQNFANVSQGGQAKSIASYSQNLQQHHGSQMPNKQMPNAGGPQNQGSPGMMHQAPEGINAYYNAPGGMDAPGRMGPGPAGAQGGTSNHALQDYQMQLMLLEQQNKKRLLMARQEQDNMGTGPRDATNGPPGQGGAAPGAGGPNNQFSDSSPQAVRANASPNPTDQMKRGTPQMGNAGMPSPLPEGAQSRGSPNPMSFNISGQMDPNAPQFPNMMPMNGMRPPSSHPSQPFSGQMNPQQQQQMMAARQQQQQSQQQGQQQGQQGQQQGQQQVGSQGNPPGQWPQGAPNGTQMVPQSSQNPIQGTPQQQSRPMPPPSAPGASNNRTVSPTPPTPKPKRKEVKGKDTTKRPNPQKKTTMTSGATPAAESTGDAETTPATPITPVTQGPFVKSSNGNVNGASVTNGQSAGGAGASAPAPTAAVAPPHPDPTQGPSFGMENGSGIVDFPMEFGNTLSNGAMMEDFDFDSFLHDNDNEPSTFDFNTTFTGLEGTGEIGATE